MCDLRQGIRVGRPLGSDRPIRGRAELQEPQLSHLGTPKPSCTFSPIKVTWPPPGHKRLSAGGWGQCQLSEPSTFQGASRNFVPSMVCWSVAQSLPPVPGSPPTVGDGHDPQRVVDDGIHDPVWEAAKG